MTCLATYQYNIAVVISKDISVSWIFMVMLSCQITWSVIFPFVVKEDRVLTQNSVSYDLTRPDAKNTHSTPPVAFCRLNNPRKPEILTRPHPSSLVFLVSAVQCLWPNNATPASPTDNGRMKHPDPVHRVPSVAECLLKMYFCIFML